MSPSWAFVSRGADDLETFMLINHRSALLGFCLTVLTATGSAGEPLRVYGTGTAGSGGIAPELWANSTPRPGAGGFALRIEYGLGGASAAMLVSAGPADQNFGGLRVLVRLDRSVVLPSFQLSGTGAGKGSATVPLPLPNMPVLIGASFHAQAVVIDPKGAWVGIAATPGLAMTLKRPGMLLATRSIGGSADPQSAVDLASGRMVDFSGGRIDNAHGVTFTNDGKLALVASSLSKRYIAVCDATSFPPRYQSTIPVQGGKTSPWSVSVNPDGVRGYLVNQGPGGSGPLVECFWVVPGSNFGKPFPGGGFDPQSISVMRLVFTPDGNTGFLSSLGIGGAPDLVRYDTKISSPTYHKVTGRTSFAGKFLFDHAISKDGARVYVSAAPLGQLCEVAIVDAATMQIVDWDPGAPGIQNIGGEKSRPKTPLGRVVTAIAVDPRHRFVYIAVSGNSANPTQMIRVDTDPRSSGFRSFKIYTSGLPTAAMLGGLKVSAAGDLVYLAVLGGSNVHEIDAATLTTKRVLKVHPSPNELALR